MSTQSKEDSTPGQNQLQKTFIAMVFAFVISFHAQTITEFLAVLTNNWTSFPIGSGINLDFLAVAAQIFLALLMISISWIMWSKSQAQAHLNDINQIFTIKFFTFILEILLVTLYYGLAKSLEVDFSEFNKTKETSKYITTVSPLPEIFIMSLIFIIFLIWDITTDIINSPSEYKSSDCFDSFIDQLCGYFVYCSVSTICLIASIFLLVIIPQNPTALTTILADLALICILLFFYQAKVYEYYGLKIFPWQATRKNTKRADPPTKWEKCRVILLSITYLVFALMVGLCILQ
ncbi:hypothetical protein [Acinetobacter radioresistens]|uniref:hypothetical protein n=1 Tax=Acinetobacter radioresistens TaxID=40216 RepID=UPI0006195869|nr:hypothetical protein [Acinetobacter radioresistens]